MSHVSLVGSGDHVLAAMELKFCTGTTFMFLDLPLSPIRSLYHYFSRIRCKLEQSAAVWSSSLTKKNSDDLERVQKSAIRIIYGKPYESYSQTLKELDIMRLSERRENICLKFAKNSLKLNNFKRLFPEHANLHDMKTRKRKKYKISKYHGKRYEVSSIPSMQKMLNRDYLKQKTALKNLLSPTNFASLDLLLR